MKKIYIVWALIIVSLLGTTTFLGINILNKDKEYKNLEDNIEQVVSKYLGQYIEEYPNSGSKKILITDVINKGYEVDMNVNYDECEGYVVVRKVSFAYEYDGYIKCNNYITKGFGG